MKMLYANLLKGAAVAAVLAVSSTAQAADLPQIEVGQSITVSRANNQTIWEFVAPDDGQLQILCSNVTPIDLTWGTFLFNSPDLTEANMPYYAIQTSKTSELVNGGRLYTYLVTKGTSYYFTRLDVTIIEPETFTFLMQEGDIVPEVSAVYPTPSTTSDYYFPDNPYIQIVFNLLRANTTFTGDSYLTFEKKDGSQGQVYVEPKKVNDLEPRWDIYLYEAIIKAKAQGLKTNSNFTVNIAPFTIDGEPLSGPYVNEEGRIVLNYRYGELTSCTDEEVPDPVLSYYPKDGTAGIVTYTFESPLKPLNEQKPVLELRAGHFREPSGDDDTETWPLLPTAPLAIDGNTLTIDLRGVVRPNPEDKNAINTLKMEDNSYVNIRIFNLRDMNGNLIDYHSLDHIEKEVPFVLFEKVPMEAEFSIGGKVVSNPNTSLVGVNSVELWVNDEKFDAQGIVFDSFDYMAGDKLLASIPAKDCNPHEDYGMVYDIPVPAIVQQTGGNIVLTVQITSADGFNYEGDLSQTFVFEGTGEGPVQPGDTMDAPEVQQPGQAIVSSVSSVDVSWGGQEIFLCEGAHAEWYVNSDYDAAPDDLGQLKNGKLQVTVVEYNPELGGTPDSGLSARRADAAEDGTLWHLNIKLPSEAFFTKGVFNIVIPEGTVKNAEGMVNDKYIVTLWVVDLYTGGDMVVEPETENYGNSATVTTLPEIQVTFEGASNVIINEPAEIRLNETYIASDEYVGYVYNEETGDVTGVTFNVASITQEKGEYMLFIPEGSFVIDGMYLNNEFVGSYSVLESTGIASAIAPEDGRYVVYSLSGVLVLDTEDASALAGLAPGFYVINGKKVLVRK